MKNTRSHSPISLVIQAAGLVRRVSFPVDDRSLASSDVDDEEEWMERRRRSLIRMRAKRDLRRALATEDDETEMAEDVIVFKPEILGTPEPALPIERRIVIEDGDDGDDEASE